MMDGPTSHNVLNKERIKPLAQIYPPVILAILLSADRYNFSMSADSRVQSLEVWKWSQMDHRALCFIMPWAGWCAYTPAITPFPTAFPLKVAVEGSRPEPILADRRANKPTDHKGQFIWISHATAHGR